MSQPEVLRHDIPDVLSAALIPGKKRPIHGGRGGIHCADALLISREVPMVAVADAPERNPKASSSFLNRFADALAASRVSFSGSAPDASFAAVVDLVTALIRTVDYHDSTTFSALIPVKNGDEPAGIILHTGDSLILRIEPETGTAVQISRTSHVLVGRAPALFQTEIVPFLRGDLFVVASDGITDLARTRGIVPAALLSGLGPAPAPRTVVSHIVDSAAVASVRLDDIAVVCAAPGAFSLPIEGGDDARLILA